MPNAAISATTSLLGDQQRCIGIRYLLIWVVLAMFPLASLYIKSKEVALFDTWYVENFEPSSISTQSQKSQQQRQQQLEPTWNQVQKRLWKLQHRQLPLSEDKRKTARRQFFMRGRRGDDEEKHRMMIGWDIGDDPKVRKLIERQQKQLAKQQGQSRALVATSKPEPAHPHAGALDVNGTVGYVANPKALQIGRLDYLKGLHGKEGVSSNADDSFQNDFWSSLSGYESQYRNGTRTGQQQLKSDFICAFGPGRGMEQDSGYRLLAEKIQVSGKYSKVVDKELTTTESKVESDSNESRSSRPIRVLCALYTHSGMRDLARTQALLWGYKCGEFILIVLLTIDLTFSCAYV